MLISKTFQHSLSKSTILAGLSVSALFFCSCDGGGGSGDNIPTPDPITLNTVIAPDGVFDAIISDDSSSLKFTVIDAAGTGTAQLTSAAGVSVSQATTFNFSNTRLDATRSGLTDNDVENALNNLVRLGGPLQEEYDALRSDQTEAAAITLIDSIHATEPGFILKLREGDNAFLNIALVDGFSINPDSVSLSTKRIEFFGEPSDDNTNNSLAINPVLSFEEAIIEVLDASVTYTAPAN